MNISDYNCKYSFIVKSFVRLIKKKCVSLSVKVIEYCQVFRLLVSDQSPSTNNVDSTQPRKLFVFHDTTQNISTKSCLLRLASYCWCASVYLDPISDLVTRFSESF